MSSHAPARSRRVMFSVLLCGSALAAGGAAGYSLHRLEGAPTRTAQPPPDPDARSLSALGQVQPAGGVIAIYGPPGDRILKFAEPLHPGQTVKAGAPLVILESRKARQKELALAETQLNQARQQREAIRKAADAKLEELETETSKLDNRKKEDLAVQDARIQVLRAQEGEARNQLRRLEGLSGQRVPPTEMDQARLAVDVAKGQLEAAQAVRTQTQNTYRRQSELAQKKKKGILTERDQALQPAALRAGLVCLGPQHLGAGVLDGQILLLPVVQFSRFGLQFLELGVGRFPNRLLQLSGLVQLRLGEGQLFLAGLLAFEDDQRRAGLHRLTRVQGLRELQDAVPRWPVDRDHAARGLNLAEGAKRPCVRVGRRLCRPCRGATQPVQGATRCARCQR